MKGVNFRAGKGASSSASVGDKSGGLSSYLRNKDTFPALKSRQTISAVKLQPLEDKPKISKTSLIRPSASTHSLPTSHSLPRLFNSKQLESFPELKQPQIIGKKGNLDSSPTIQEEVSGDQENEFMKACPLGCGRKFGTDVIEKHMEICQKVFTGKRMPYDSSKFRWKKNFKKK